VVRNLGAIAGPRRGNTDRRAKGRQRVLLAALLLHPGRPIAADALAEVMWDGAPPSGATVTLRSHILRLRRVLGARAGARVVTQYPGYLLQAGENEVDVLRFRCLCRDGGAALREGAWVRADGLLGEALDLWRGAPLADVPSVQMRREEVPGLEELRLQAEEWRTDAALRLGRHNELVAELQALAAQHPLRERFHAQLMLALYRCGRQAEALSAYQHARQVLIDQLGTEPGSELQELHQQVLSADPALTILRSALPVSDAESSPIPRELPPAVRHFNGRNREIAALTRLTNRSGKETPETVVISAIGGTAGVGKTALAVHWAHQAAGRFPDGQLYVNLRGCDPAQPMTAEDALVRFLRSLGVPGQDIPADKDARAARYRSMLADKRMLVILDNAGSAEQVRPLLPGTPACTVVVTSRDALSGLVAPDGATRLDLDLLPEEDAVGLLRMLIGARVDADPETAAELAGQCCRLPLALRVAAELAANRPEVPLTKLTSELADRQKRLDQLDAGADPRTAIRSVFSWSYQHLDDGAARTFRLAGLCPGSDFDGYAAAALRGTNLDMASHALDLLARAHLIQPTRLGRYGMHDLLRVYACELAVAEDDDGERQAALTRLFDHYLHTAAAAMDILFPAERHHRPRAPAATSPAPRIADQAEALAWLDGERPNLVAAVGHAVGHGWPGHATNLSATLSGYLKRAGQFADAVIIYGHALQAARHSGDMAAEASALRDLAGVSDHHGSYQEAADYLDLALALSRETGDQTGETLTLNSLGITNIYLGRYPQAAVHLRQSLVLARKTGDKISQALALGNLGVAERLQGQLQEATEHYQQSLTLCDEIGDRSGLGETLVRLGYLNLRQNRQEAAADQFQQALATFREIGERPGEARALMCLGEVSLRVGLYQQAAGQLRQALAIFREIGDKPSQARVFNGLGEASLPIGQPADARAWHTAALEVASRFDLKSEQARAHDGLGLGCHASGNLGQARHHWHEALRVFTDIGAPEAEQVRARLTGTADDHCVR
jgi:DNA-binding SARP family transcriptional activator/Tfp pilus assembly protein PilF